jgi:hypothetical protein
MAVGAGSTVRPWHKPILVNEAAECLTPSWLSWIRIADPQRCLAHSTRCALAKGGGEDDVRCSNRRIRCGPSRADGDGTPTSGRGTPVGQGRRTVRVTRVRTRRPNGQRFGAGSTPLRRRIAHALEGVRTCAHGGQLAMDPAIGPGGVLPGQPRYQLGRARRQSRASRTALLTKRPSGGPGLDASAATSLAARRTDPDQPSTRADSARPGPPGPPDARLGRAGPRRPRLPGRLVRSYGAGAAGVPEPGPRRGRTTPWPIVASSLPQATSQVDGVDEVCGPSGSGRCLGGSPRASPILLGPWPLVSYESSVDDQIMLIGLWQRTVIEDSLVGLPRHVGGRRLSWPMFLSSGSS